MTRGYLAILSLLLCGCSTSINYSIWDANTPVESTALRFRLQESTVTLSAAPASSTTAAQKPSSTCPSSTSPTANTDWWQCFAQVSAQSTPTASDLATGKVYVATADDADNFGLSTTAISGTAITAQDGLYSVVTVKYTNNTGAAVTAAGTGAVAGFGIAGPYGAAGGFILGGASVLIPQAVRSTGHAFLTTSNAPALPKPPMDYICANEPVNLAMADKYVGTAIPSISFPVAIKETGADQFAPSSEINAVSLPAANAAQSACWHVLPNMVGSARPINSIGAKAPRTNLAAGDGWLYRVVAADTDLTIAPPGSAAAAVDAYFATSPRQDFPYSSCRKVTLQITWWQELATAIAKAKASGTATNPGILTYDVSVADPRFVAIAHLKKGGAVNFRPDCGANVSADPDASSGATLNAAVTSAESIYKAEQTWSGTQKKK